MATEEGNHVMLETVSHCTRVCTFAHFKAVDDSIAIKNIVQLAGVDW
jgi:hypothetical protein